MFFLIRLVVHWGPSRSIEQYLQESGRAGRDQQPARAVLLYTSHHLGRADLLKPYLLNSEGQCRREMLMEHFPGSSEVSQEVLLHDCCDVCYVKCVCEEEHSLDQFWVYPEPVVPTEPDPELQLTADQEEELKECLLELKDMLLDGSMSLFGSVIQSGGISDAFIKLVVKEARHIQSVEDCIERLPVWSTDIAVMVTAAISDVLELNIQYIDQTELRDNYADIFACDLQFAGMFDDDWDEYLCEDAE